MGEAAYAVDGITGAADVPGADVSEPFERLMDRPLYRSFTYRDAEEAVLTSVPDDEAKRFEAEIVAAIESPGADEPGHDLTRAVKSAENDLLYVRAGADEDDSLKRPVTERNTDHRWVPVDAADGYGRAFIRAGHWDIHESELQGSPHYGSLTHNVGRRKWYTGLPRSGIPDDAAPDGATVFRDGPAIEVRVEDGTFTSPFRDATVDIEAGEESWVYRIVPTEFYEATVVGSPYRTQIRETMARD